MKVISGFSLVHPNIGSLAKSAPLSVPKNVHIFTCWCIFEFYLFLCVKFWIQELCLNKLETFEDALSKREKFQHAKLKNEHS